MLDDWFHNPRVQHSKEESGNPIRDGVMLFGWRVGPVKEMSGVLHEMAHLIEIDDERCHLPGWGLRLRQVEVPGHGMFTEPCTFQACAREIRTVAIQKVITESLSLPFDSSYWAKVIYNWVPGNLFARTEYPEVPDWKDEGATFAEIEGAARKAIAADIDRRAAALTLRQVRAEWDRKCALVASRLEKATAVA